MKGNFLSIGNLTAGLLSGLLALVYSLTCAALIFHSNLVAFLPYGIYFALISGIISNIIFAYRSSFALAIQTPSPIPSVILAAAITSVFQLHQTYGLLNITLTIVYAGVLTGIISWLLGQFKQGNLVRYIPFPVIGGFITGIGWGLILGGVSIIFGKVEHFSQFLETKNYVQFIPALVLGVILFVMTNKIKHFLVMPIIILIAFLLTHLFFWISSHYFHMNSGFIFFKSFQQINPLTIFANFKTQHIAWISIFKETPIILVMVIVVIIITLLNFSSLEIQNNQETNMNNELRLTGYMNMLSGLFAGLPVYISVSTTTVNIKSGATSSFSAIIAGLVCLIGLLLGSYWFSWIPKFLISGFLFYLGGAFFYEWLYKGFLNLSYKDYSIVWAILIVGAVWNFLLAFLVGVLLAAIFFVLEYRKINSIKYSLDGKTFQSNVKRSSQHQKILRQHGEELYIIKLQGFLFFGTAFILLSNIKKLLQKKKKRKTKFILFDFSLVHEIDVSSVYSFLRMKQVAEENKITFVFTNLRKNLQDKLKRYDVIKEKELTIKCFGDLDHGVEWWESQILKKIKSEEKFEDLFAKQIKMLFPDKEKQKQFLKYLEKKHIKKGDYLFHEGDPADYMIFLQSGEVSVYKTKQRLRKMKAGSVMGEIGFYLETTRVADVKATSDCDYYQLSKENFEKMQKKDPKLALIFQKSIIKNLSEIVQHSNDALQILSR